MRKKRLKLLLLEDNPSDAKLVLLALEAAREPAFDVEWVRDLPDAVARLSRDGVDVVLTDLNLPSSIGLDTLKALRSKNHKLPMIVLTGSYMNASLGQDAVHAGAQDYLDKSDLQPLLLPKAIAYAIERNGLERYKEEFVQNINHELRTPLTVAYGFLNSLLDGLAGPLNDKQKKFLDIAKRNVAYLNELIEEFAEATRAEAGKLFLHLRRVDMGELIAGAAADMGVIAEAKGVALCAGPMPALEPVLADPKRCRQILFNLIANAVKFTPKGGRIQLHAEHLPEEPGFLRICVADSGPGIPPEARERIFDRLYQAHLRSEDGRSGLGLGLYICREIAVRQGGRTWVESGPEGSRFYWTVPIFSFARQLESFRKAVPREEVSLLECGVLPSGHELQAQIASKIMGEAREILQADDGLRGILLPETVAEGMEGTLYLALLGDKESVERAARGLETALSGMLRQLRTGLSGGVRVIPVRSAHGPAAELEREIERITSSGPSKREPPS